MTALRWVPALGALLALLLTGGGDRLFVTWWMLGRPAPLPPGQAALRIGVDASYPPFADVASNGTLWGLEVDLAHELAQQLGLPLDLQNVDAGSGLDALPASAYDAILGGIVYDPTLLKTVRFSPAYFAAGPVLVVRAPDVPHPDPVPQRVAVEVGAPWPDVIGKLQQDGSTVQPVWDDQDGLAQLESGAADAYLVDRPTALEEQRDHPSDNLQLLDEDPGGVYSYRIAEGRANRYLAFALNQAVRELAQRGALAALEVHWFETPRGS